MIKGIDLKVRECLCCVLLKFPRWMGNSNELWEDEKAKRIDFNCSFLLDGRRKERERNLSSGNFWTSIDWNSTFKLESWASKTINSGQTFQYLMHSLCVFFLSPPFPSCPLFFHHHLHRAVVLSGALEKFIQKIIPWKHCYACNTTTDTAEKSEVHEKIESPKPSRCNFACHAIQIQLLERAVSAATKKITKTKLQIATKKERMKGHVSSGMGKKTAKKVKVSALKVVATSFRRFHFLCCISHKITCISDSPWLHVFLNARKKEPAMRTTTNATQMHSQHWRIFGEHLKTSICV